MAKTTIIHVNQHVIKSNRKNGICEPVLTIKTYNTNDYGKEAVLRLPDGTEVAKVVYRPDKPLSCGAHVWLETKCDVEVVQ